MKLRITDLPEKYHPAIDELPGDMRLIASGMDAVFQGKGVLIALVLSEIFSGQRLYVSKVQKPLRRWRDDQIRSRYDQGGITGKELARQWGLSQRSVEEILATPTETMD
ncbi:MAG: hypothetical protein GX087_05210 [Desulfobulbaceae bacterium]|nr:hypothetical protein [Desulfobulbaceae bacterium]